MRKTADTLVLPIGNDVTFTVTVTNEGPSPATGVELTDLLPAGLAFVSATPVQGYTPTTGVWAIGALAVGAQTTLTLRATVQEAGAFTNRAAKTAQGELDPNPGNDVSGVTVNGQAADVQVVKTVDRTMPLVGETVTFTVTVTNNGPNAASGVEVLDMLSARLTFVSATPSQGTYTAATGLWSVGTLASRGGRGHGDVTGDGHGHAGRAAHEPGGEDRPGSTRSQPGQRSGQHCPPGPAGGGPGGDEEQWRGAVSCPARRSCTPWW